MTYEFKGTHSVYKDSYPLTGSVLIRLLLEPHILKTETYIHSDKGRPWFDTNLQHKTWFI